MPRSAKNVGYGGSYTGSVAAYMRLRYPHTFHAVLASSSVVKFLVGTEAWDRSKFWSAISVGNSIAEVASKTCQQKVAAGLAALNSPLARTADGRAMLASASGCAILVGVRWCVVEGSCEILCLWGVPFAQTWCLLSMCTRPLACVALSTASCSLCPNQTLDRWDELVEDFSNTVEMAFWGPFQVRSPSTLHHPCCATLA